MNARLSQLSVTVQVLSSKQHRAVSSSFKTSSELHSILTAFISNKHWNENCVLLPVSTHTAACPILTLKKCHKPNLFFVFLHLLHINHSPAQKPFHPFHISQSITLTKDPLSCSKSEKSTSNWIYNYLFPPAKWEP